MGTIPFNKLNLKRKNEIKIIKISDQEIEIKQYLPIQEKLDVIRNSIIRAQDENGFFNGIKLELHCTLQIIYAYTNLKFTEKQLEKEDEIYDLMENNGIIDEIFSAIPEDETNMIMNATEELAAAIKSYESSALGILENVKTTYNNSNIDLNKVIESIKSSESLNNSTELKEIVDSFMAEIQKDNNN